MSTYQVKFKTLPDPQCASGYILQFERIGDITHTESPLQVIFADRVKLVGAFLKAGLYLHSFGHADTGKDVMPDSDQNYEVTDQMMRDIGFDIPA